MYIRSDKKAMTVNALRKGEYRVQLQVKPEFWRSETLLERKKERKKETKGELSVQSDRNYGFVGVESAIQGSATPNKRPRPACSTRVLDSSRCVPAVPLMAQHTLFFYFTRKRIKYTVAQDSSPMHSEEQPVNKRADLHRERETQNRVCDSVG